MAARHWLVARMDLAWRVVRLAAAVALLAVSLLAVVPAPTHRLWLLSIGVTEYGHFVAPVALLWLWPGWQRTWNRRIALGCALVAAACFLSPVVRALLIAQTLPATLTAAFGEPTRQVRPDAALRARPVDPAMLFVGAPIPAAQVTTVRYAVRNGEGLDLDVYLPPRHASERPVPIVMVVHGGGWSVGQRDDLPALNHHLAHLGYVVVAPSYRLVPVHTFPAAVDDVRTALALVRGRAREWNADPERVALIGRSAGAQLALLVAYRHDDDAVRGVVSIYGPADLRYAWEHPGNPRVYDGIGTIERYLGGRPADVGQVYDDASPYQFVGPNTPATLLVHGGRDEIVSVVQSQRLAERLRAHGRPHVLVAPGWATHGCDYHFAGPCGQLSTFAIERFLAAVL